MGCITKYVSLYKEEVTMPFAKTITLIGTLISIAAFLLLAIPGSPAAIGKESWILLVVWCVIGYFLYKKRSQELNAIPTEELKYMLFGEKNCPLLFKYTK